MFFSPIKLTMETSALRLSIITLKYLHMYVPIPSKQSTSADVSLTSVQRQFNVELTLDWRKTDICQRRLFTGLELKHYKLKDGNQVIPMRVHFVAYYLTIFTTDKCCMKWFCGPYICPADFPH